MQKFLLSTFVASCATLSANLIPIGLVPSTGNGLGAVNTSISFSNSNNNGNPALTESGCVGILGGAQSSSSAVCPSGFAGGDNSNPQAPSVKNQTYTAAQLGFSSTTNFANLVLLFNAIESDQNITLNNIALTLYGDGVSQTFSYVGAPISFNALPGQGNAGYGFQLDASQAAAANAFLALHPTTQIGTAATASGGLSSGDESIALSTITSTQPGGGPSGGQVPEPSSIYLTMAGMLLVSIGMVRRQKSR